MKNLLLATALVVGGAVGANAATLGFDLVVSGNTNTPDMKLTNTSDAALLTNINISIGDPRFNFDAVTDLTDPDGGTSTLNQPDANDGGGVRADVIDIDFMGFDPNEMVSWTADFDEGSDNTVEDYRTILFNNGDDTANSVITATFSMPQGVVSLTIPDGNSGGTSFTFGAEAAAPIPVPAALPLLLTALGGLGLAGWRRKRAGMT